MNGTQRRLGAGVYRVQPLCVGLAGRRGSPAILGFLAFVLFSVTELLRTCLMLFAFNRAWRGGYAAAADESTRDQFRGSLAGFVGWNDALFFLFTLAFFLGTLLYGLALRHGVGLERAVGVVLLVWAFFSLATLVEEATGFGPLAGYLGWVGAGYQPIARLLTAVWLWRSSGEPVVLGGELAGSSVSGGEGGIRTPGRG